jgi:hypothetical protein
VPASLFVLTKQAELDVSLGDDHFSVRIEVLRALNRKNTFRVRFWRTELFRIQSTFPQSRRGTPAHQASDELILVDASDNMTGSWDAIRSSSADAALRAAVAAVTAWASHSAGRKSEEA